MYGSCLSARMRVGHSLLRSPGSQALIPSFAFIKGPPAAFLQFGKRPFVIPRKSFVRKLLTLCLHYLIAVHVS